MKRPPEKRFSFSGKRKSGSKTKRAAIAAAVLCGILLCGCAVLFLFFRGNGEDGEKEGAELRVSFLDVGQGDCVLFLLPGGSAALVDAGPSESAPDIVNRLRALGVEKIAALFLTHPHSDHIGGVGALFSAFEVEKVILSEISDLLSSSMYEPLPRWIREEEGCEKTLVSSGQTLALGDLIFSVLGPNSTVYDDLNDTSLLLRASYGETSFFLTGDAGIAAEGDLLDLYESSALKSDVLKVGHHGSKTSTSLPFLKAVSPEYAVIQCALVNAFGHPNAVTLSTLASLGVTVCRNDLQGEVTFFSDGKELSLLTEKEK